MAVPAGHERHEVFVDAPMSGLYVPAGHCENVRLSAAAPAMGQKPPRGQAEHSTERKSDEYVAGGHGVHALAPDVGLYEPGMQGKHVDGSKRPWKFTYSPGEQGMQPVPVAAWRLPTGQRVHRVAPRKRSLPSEHAEHAPEPSSWVCSSHS